MLAESEVPVCMVFSTSFMTRFTINKIAPQPINTPATGSYWSNFKVLSMNKCKTSAIKKRMIEMQVSGNTNWRRYPPWAMIENVLVQTFGLCNSPTPRPIHRSAVAPIKIALPIAHPRKDLKRICVLIFLIWSWTVMVVAYIENWGQKPIFAKEGKSTNLDAIGCICYK